MKRAQEAGVLAKGKVVFQQTFSEDRVKCKTDKYELNTDAKSALDEFASKVKGLQDQYYVEIQGHTDDTGSPKYNDELGQRRADEVRRYLSRSAQLPLNRMSTISYGDTLPVAPNKTKDGRAQNRRVVLVVLHMQDQQQLGIFSCHNFFVSPPADPSGPRWRCGNLINRY